MNIEIEKAIAGLNDNEWEVFKAAWRSSRDQGHDFGFTEDVMEDSELRRFGFTDQQLGGFLSALEKKGLLAFYPAITTDASPFRQFFMEWLEELSYGEIELAEKRIEDLHKRVVLPGEGKPEKQDTPEQKSIRLLYVESHSEGTVYRISIDQDLSGFIKGHPFIVTVLDQSGKDKIEIFADYSEAMTVAFNAAVADGGRIQLVKTE